VRRDAPFPFPPPESNVMDSVKTGLVVCECQHCKNNLEFEASELSPGEVRVVECPHCFTLTRIYDPRTRVPPVIQKAPTVLSARLLSKSVIWGIVGTSTTLILIIFFIRWASLLPDDPQQIGFSIGYQQCGIDYGLKKGEPIGNIKTKAESLYGTNVQAQSDFISGYYSGYRTSENTIDKLTRDAIKAQEDAEHPLGY
jgi:hypothetical protein